MIDSDTMATCIHEAAHCVALLIVGSHISEVVISGRSGHCRSKSKNSPLPDWDSSVAAAMCAVELIGVIATCQAYGFPDPETDADFERHGGRGDLINFRRRAALLTYFDEHKTAELRARAIGTAHLIVDEYGRAIDAVADDLYINGQLDHAGVCRAVRRVPDDAEYLLNRLEHHPGYFVEPPPRVLSTPRGQLLEMPDGSLLAVRKHGGARIFDSLAEAYRVL